MDQSLPSTDFSTGVKANTVHEYMNAATHGCKIIVRKPYRDSNFARALFDRQYHPKPVVQTIFRDDPHEHANGQYLDSGKTEQSEQNSH